AALLADSGTQQLLHALSPLIRLFGGDVTARAAGEVSDAYAVLALAFTAAETSDEDLVCYYDRAFSLAAMLDSESPLRFIVFLLRHLRGTAARLAPRRVPLVARCVRPVGGTRSPRAALRRMAEQYNEHVTAIRVLLAGRW